MDLQKPTRGILRMSKFGSEREREKKESLIHGIIAKTKAHLCLAIIIRPLAHMSTDILCLLAHSPTLLFIGART